ncbi:MAG TPA: SatD family protein [Bacteroidales bacterium]|nr:SatD family protein [Bacteroidales bacterium]
MQIVGVLTGDIVGSTKLTHNDRESLMQQLKFYFDKLNSFNNKKLPFRIFRGDSFQGVSFKPETALLDAVLLRSSLIAATPDTSDYVWDARLGIGIGTIEFHSEDVLEMDGEAFRNSGLMLDRLKNEERTGILTPWNEVNEEMAVHSLVIDTLINRWSVAQAEVVAGYLEGKTQSKMASDIGISQAAVNYRLKTANWHVIDRILQRYKTLISGRI